MRKYLTLALSASVLALAACGGGGGGSSSGGGGAVVTPPPPPPPPPATGNTFTPGVFEASSNFKNQCESPRVGPDANGETWPDVAGTASDERFWLRSWSDETYLWYDEITDQDPDNFDDKIAYFNTLVTQRTTPSGNNVDNFHGVADTEDYRRRQSGGPSVGYGWTVDLIQSTPPRQAVVAFTYGGSASADLVERGAEILEIDGADLVNGNDVDTLNAGLFPQSAGETHTFKVRDADGTEREFTATTVEVEPPTVVESRIFDMDDGAGGTVKAAYLNFDSFSVRTAEKALYDAFQSYVDAGVEELFLDLRYNGGGFLNLSGQLAYMIAGDQGNSTYYLTEFNGKTGNTDPVTGDTIRPTPFWSESLGFDPASLPSGRPLPTLNLDSVSILSLGGTCSASEAVINGLRGVDVDVQLIGSTTCGKPFGFYPTDNCGTTYFTIQFEGTNEKGFGDYADGFAPGEAVGNIGAVVPGCDASDDLSKALGDPTESMLSTAIAYAETGECPTTAVAEKPDVAPSAEVMLDDPAMDLRNDPRIALRTLLEQRAILPDESNR